MTYLQFLHNFGAPAKHKVYALVGGESRLREDALKVLHRRIENTNKKQGKGDTLRVWYHLDEIKENPLDILHASAFGIRTIVWAPDLVGKETTKKLLDGLSRLSGRSVIVDASSEILPTFREIYKKFSKGVVVDCSKKPDLEMRGLKFGGFVTARLVVSGIHKIPDKSVLFDLTSEAMTHDTLFNIIFILEALGREELRVSDLHLLGLLRREPETFLVKSLFSRGKQEVLKYSFRGVDSSKFFERLYQELILRLRVKSTSFMKATTASSKLGIRLHRYCEYQKELKKVDYKSLYRRLYLVFSLLRWRAHAGSMYLALLYW